MPRNMLLVALWFLVSTISHASDARSTISKKRARSAMRIIFSFPACPLAVRIAMCRFSSRRNLLRR